MVDAPAGGNASSKKPGILSRLWKKADIQPVFLILMVKGSIPSAIALAAYEATKWHQTYTTLGYLVAIMAHLSLAIQPRAKYIQAMSFSVLFVCLGAAVALLQVQCAVAARSPVTAAAPSQSGSSGGQEAPIFDSAATTVSAVWLCITVFIANFIRAARPQLMLPIIQYSIFTMIASIYSPSFQNMAQGEAFVRRLLITFLTGFGIATGVSLFIFPMTSRMTVSKQMAGLHNIFKGAIGAHGAYLKAISTGGPGCPEEVAAAKRFRSLGLAMGELFAKIKLELSFARREVAYGKLGPEHLSDIYELQRVVLQPIMGMLAFTGMVETINQHRANRQDLPDATRTLSALEHLEDEEWNEVMRLSSDAYLRFQMTLMGGLTHASYLLEFDKKPKPKNGDVEDKAGTSPTPGDAGFTARLETEVQNYHEQRNEVIGAWAGKKEITLPAHFLDRKYTDDHNALQKIRTTAAKSKLNEKQLYLILYLHYLTFRAGAAVLDLARYADARVSDGTMKKKRIINPGFRRIRKLWRDAVSKSDADDAIGNEANGGTNVFLGDALQKKKDPEHLPPANFYERITNHFRLVPKLLSSEAAGFALRATVATMSIGIIGFLRPTRAFFLTQRGVWAMIMTAISMDPHSGQSIFGYLARTVGTLIAAVSAIVIWYMCDKKHAAIIPVYTVYCCFWILFLLKKPALAPVAIISSVTAILIIGYELEVDIIGLRLATSNGQAYYDIQLLASYRFVAVVAGLAVAFIFTIFPYPLTTHGTLRKDLGNSFYILANYYSCVHTTLEARLGLGPEALRLSQDRSHPLAQLNYARRKVFSKNLLMLNRLREYHKFTKFEPTIGGKFPRDTYSELIDSLRNVFIYLSMIDHASTAFIHENPLALTYTHNPVVNLTAKNSESSSDGKSGSTSEEARWLEAFRKFASTSAITTHDLTSALCLLSASLRNAQPLPPYLRSNFRPKQDVASIIRNTDPTLLGVEHFHHPCYAAFAVGEVASAFIDLEMAKVVRLVKELVGEVDFSFHVEGGKEKEVSALLERLKTGAGVGVDEKRKGE